MTDLTTMAPPITLDNIADLGVARQQATPDAIRSFQDPNIGGNVGLIGSGLTTVANALLAPEQRARADEIQAVDQANLDAQAVAEAQQVAYQRARDASADRRADERLDIQRQNAESTRALNLRRIQEMDQRQNQQTNANEFTNFGRSLVLQEGTSIADGRAQLLAKARELNIPANVAQSVIGSFTSNKQSIGTQLDRDQQSTISGLQAKADNANLVAKRDFDDGIARLNQQYPTDSELTLWRQANEGRDIGSVVSNIQNEIPNSPWQQKLGLGGDDTGGAPFVQEINDYVAANPGTEGWMVQAAYDQTFKGGVNNDTWSFDKSISSKDFFRNLESVIQRDMRDKDNLIRRQSGKATLQDAYTATTSANNAKVNSQKNVFIADNAAQFYSQ